jgi:hypothetical protein
MGILKKLLTKEQIHQIDDEQREIVSVPEWGGDVLVRGMTGKDRDAFEADIAERRGKKIEFHLNNFRAKLVVRTVIDEDGKLLFSDADVKWLGDKSAVALGRVFEVASRLSGLSEEDIEDLTKNLESDPSDDSGLDSV